MMTATRKTKIANIVLWAAYLLTLAASIGHVAWAFGTLEFPGSAWVGWLAALAVDAGLAALAYGVQQRKRARRSARDLWAGVLLFAGISAFANLLHAMTAVTGFTVTLATFAAVDALALAKAVILSASLPLLVVYLGEVVSSDDAQAAEQAERERVKVERLAERDRVKAGQFEVSNTTAMDTARAVKAEQDAHAKATALDTLAGYLDANPDTPVAELARMIGRSRTTVYSYLGELEAAGRVRRNGNGEVTQ
jgi:hypothetical protein